MDKKRIKQYVAMLCLVVLGISSFGGVLRGDAETVRPSGLLMGTLPETEEPQDPDSIIVSPGQETPSAPELPQVPTNTPAPTPAPATPTPPVTPSAEEREPEVIVAAPATSSFCNGTYSGQYKTVNGVTYVCAQGVMSALDESVHIRMDGDCLYIETDGVSISIYKSLDYFLCNERYLYAPEGILWEADGVYVPAEELAKCFGGSVSLEEESGYLQITAEDIVPLVSGSEFYNADDLYWLSHVIYAESGCEPLRGQIAVGNVVLNRIESSRFVNQNDIYSVIFAAGQFEVVDNRSIYLEPDEEAVVAAKIALEGYEIIPGALFFAQFCLGSSYIVLDWIGAHCFMTLA